jgi:hypothetical protein
MYGVAGEKRPIFSESDAFLYNICDPNIGSKPNIIPKPTLCRVKLPDSDSLTF